MTNDFKKLIRFIFPIKITYTVVIFDMFAKINLRDVLILDLDAAAPSTSFRLGFSFGWSTLQETSNFIWKKNRLKILLFRGNQQKSAARIFIRVLFSIPLLLLNRNASNTITFFGFCSPKKVNNVKLDFRMTKLVSFVDRRSEKSNFCQKKFSKLITTFLVLEFLGKKVLYKWYRLWLVLLHLGKSYQKSYRSSTIKEKRKK